MLQPYSANRVAGVFVVLCLPSVGIASPSFNTPPVPDRTIDWVACTDQVDPEHATVLGDRLRCGTIRAPLDHHRPAEGDITLTVVRVSAAVPERRQGSLFVNPGGPGGDAGHFAGLLGSVWQNARADDPVHGEKKRLSDNFDIVAVVPRGTAGSAPLECDVQLPPEGPLVITDTSPSNLALWDLHARRFAEGCRADPKHPYISTEQTVYDMNLVRQALGETTFNFYGVSYGTWLGAWYGATYPAQVGRMVFDAPVDFTSTAEQNYLLSAPAEQAKFDRLVTRPAIAASARYDLGVDADSVHATLRGLEPRVRDAWAGQYRSPESLMAAVAMSRWLRAEPDLSEEVMIQRIESTSFHTDAAVHDAVRLETVRMVEELYTEPLPQVRRLSASSAMIVSLPCNDTPSTTDAGAWHDVIRRHAARYPASPSGDLMNTCLFWHGPNAIKPAVDRLARAGRILMIASEFDVYTPIDGALRMLNALPNASMLVMRGLERHGAFNLTDHACSERTATRFLLDGRRPTEQITECHLDVATPALASSFENPAQVRMWLGRLRRLFDHDHRNLTTRHR